MSCIYCVIYHRELNYLITVHCTTPKESLDELFMRHMASVGLISAV